MEAENSQHPINLKENNIIQISGDLPQPAASKNRRRFLLLLNISLLSLGANGGPLLTRLYYIHGGRRQWLSSSLETAGWPILLLPIYLSYIRRRRTIPVGHSGGAGKHRLFLLTPQLAVACAALGVATGLDDFLYAYGLLFLPVSTSALLISSHLVFTAFFAWLIAKNKFTAYSINTVVLLTTGAVLLGFRGGSDRPDGVTKGKYYEGFAMTVGAAALYGLILPLIELAYRQLAGRELTFALVMEAQLVMGFFATAFCVVGMIVNKDFQAIPSEAKNYGLGEATYYVVLVWNAIFWQFFFLGLVGVIFTANTLLGGILQAVFIPTSGFLAVIFFKENFKSEKIVALILSLWGIASYSYGQYRQSKKSAPVGSPADQVA